MECWTAHTFRDLGPTGEKSPEPRSVGWPHSGPPARASSVRGEDTDDGRRVVQPPIQHHGERIIEAHPRVFHRRFLVLTLEGLVGVVELAGEENTQRLSRDARRGEVVDEDVPAIGNQISLFSKLALCCDARILTGNIEQTRGNLPQLGLDGVTVLTLQEKLL